MRIAEVMTDYQVLQQRIAAIQDQPRPGEEQLEGYVTLRLIRSEAEALLHAVAPTIGDLGASPEQLRRQLQR